MPGPDNEVRAVRRIFALYVQAGRTSCEIARMLTEEGVPPPSPRGWRKDTVGRILANEKYAGINVFGRSRSQMAQRPKLLPRSEWVCVADAFEPLVSEDVFNAAQALRKGRQRSFTNEEMLVGLERLRKRHGVVTRALIAGDPELPSVSCYTDRFGSIAAAYEQIGYAAPPSAERRKLCKSLRDRGLRIHGRRRR